MSSVSNLSVSTERFWPGGAFAAYDPHAQAGGGPVSPLVPGVQCRACGFEPGGMDLPRACCPKCLGSAWERFARSARLDRRAARYAPREGKP